MRIELPDVRELIRNQERIDKPALVIVDGVGIGRAIVQELAREMRHLLPGNWLDDQNVSSLKVRRFHNAMPAMYDGLVRLPTTMPGLETLLAEFAAFPDGRHDDQVDAVCNVAANRELAFAARAYTASGLAASGRSHLSSRPLRRSRAIRSSGTVGADTAIDSAASENGEKNNGFR